MHTRIGKAFWAQAVENHGIMGARSPDHYIKIVTDVAWAIRAYLEDT